jgi:hypothetical protein
MTVGPGKYDKLCTYVRKQSKAVGALVIIIGGDKGHGFSMQSPSDTMAGVPELLEDIAKQIRKDVEGRP